jgi:hypothetical protein
MRRSLFALALLPLILPAAAVAQDAMAAYREAVRCQDAAAIFTQQLVLTGEAAPRQRMAGYTSELRARAYGLGAKLGKSREQVHADFHDDNVSYVRRFFVISRKDVGLSPFGRAEIAYCRLARVLR